MASLEPEKRRFGPFLSILVTITSILSVSQAWTARDTHGPASMKRLVLPSKISANDVPNTVVDTTLAGDYVIRMSRQPEGSSERTLWHLYPIQAVTDSLPDKQNSTTLWTDGTRAVEALRVMASADENVLSLKPEAVLTCFQHERDHLELHHSSAGPANGDLVLLLQILQSQWVAKQQAKVNAPDSWRISIGDNSEIFLGSMTEQPGLEQLFSDVLDIDDSSTVEWVEMMTGSYQVIGRLPRSLVHKHNLLHRGIGVFVTKDQPIDLSSVDFSTATFPDVYIHQRVASKRIFPSLYDMFVGGVSTAGELSEVTAQREVAEELGLKQALLFPLSMWSDGHPILTCLVCTSYNRCLVDLYQYVMNSQRETISWQEEEVAWGEFVPYSVISAAADLSIQRAAEDGSWPRTYPPIQSDLQGKTINDELSEEYNGWEEWDFVPDGLLVWNAWLEFVRDKEKEGKTKVTTSK